VTFVGRKEKASTLRQLLGGPASDCPLEPHGQVWLWSDPKTRQDESPLVFIDCEVHNYSASHWQACDDRGQVISRKIDWLQPGGRCSKALGMQLTNAVLAPFSNAVCYFAPDLGGLRGVSRVIAGQLLANPKHNLPRAVSPCILVLLNTSSATFDASIAETRLHNMIQREMTGLKNEAREDKMEADVDSSVRNVRVVGLSTRLDDGARSAALRRRLQSISREAQRARSSSRLRFRFDHFRALSSSLLDHFCFEPSRPFSFIEASRPRAFTTREFPTHLHELMERMPSQAWLWHAVAPLVSSALALASYPPGAHRTMAAPPNAWKPADSRCPF